MWTLNLIPRNHRIPLGRLTTNNQIQQDLEAKNIKENTLANADSNHGGQMKTHQARGQGDGQPSQVRRFIYIYI